MAQRYSDTVNESAAEAAAQAAHRGSDGTDHSHVGLNDMHRGGDGSDHANVALNDAHRGGDGSDHADVASNTTHRGSDGLDHSGLQENVVDAVLTVAGGTGGGTDGTLEVDLQDFGGTALSKQCAIRILAADSEYGGRDNMNANVTFGAATKGSILESGSGWCVALTSADGEFDCPITNGSDETVWFSVDDAGATDALDHGCCVRGCVPADATWSA